MNPAKIFSPFRMLAFIVPVLAVSLNSCAVYNSQKPALVKGVDVDQTLLVARDEMKKTDMAQSLGIWVLKDQILTPQQAKVVSELYLANLDRIVTPFNIWHAAWTISNMYRLGSDEVKAELEKAYQIAIKEPDRISDDDDFKGAAVDHINGKNLTTGFIHIGGISYAYDHLVVPGNNKYIQSYQDYLQREEK